MMTLAALMACAARNITQTQSGRFQLTPGAFNTFSHEQDIQLGKQAQAEVSRSLPVLQPARPGVQNDVGQLAVEVSTANGLKQNS
ncbi:MAG: hypothetical protein ACE14M_04560 [Terriglobales bacterium]